MAFKRYTVRLFPNKEQEKMFWKHIYACRFIWNYMIDYQALNKKLLNVHLGRYELSGLLTMLKHDEEYSWINEVSRHSLVIVCTDLSRIYDRYHRGLSNLPKYKTKKGSKNIFPIRDDHNATYFKSFDYIQIPKCGKVKCRFDYRKISINLQSVKLRNPRIYFTNNEKWILSFAAEIDKIDSQDFMVFKNGPLGIDMGIKNLAVMSYKDLNGNILTETIHNINKSKKMANIDQKIKRCQRAMDRKRKVAKSIGNNYELSKRYQKEKRKYRKLLYRKNNIISDIYAKYTSHIVYDIRPSTIWLEDLSLQKFLTKRHGKLPSVLKFCKWGLFRSMLVYKSDRAGIPILFVPKNYPSSQICSSCGARRKISINERIYHCPKCGLSLDRDVNASLNLMNYKDYRNNDYPIIYSDRYNIYI